MAIDHMDVNTVNKETNSIIMYPDLLTSPPNMALHTIAGWPNDAYLLQNQRDQAHYWLQKENPEKNDYEEENDYEDQSGGGGGNES